MGPVEDSTRPAKDQEHGGRRRPIRRPRTRGCLLKGCNQRFRPIEARQRYCSPQCRQAARQWSRWKAQQSYRATAAGKEKRHGQSRRYRERVKERKLQGRPGAVAEAARVITKNFFSIISVTGRAAMRGLCSAADHRASGSARRSAARRWSASGSGSGAGRGREPGKSARKATLAGEVSRRSWAQ